MCNLLDKNHIQPQTWEILYLWLKYLTGESTFIIWNFAVLNIDSFQNLLLMLIMYVFYIQKYIRDCENYFDRSYAELLKKWYYLVQDDFQWMNL